MNGAYDITGHFTAEARVLRGGVASPPPRGYSCANYAANAATAGTAGPRGFIAPEVQTMGDPNVYLSAHIIDGYTGPGTYDSSAMHGRLIGNGGVAEGSMELSGGFIDAFRATIQSRTTLTVKPDGSGSLVLEDWYSSDSASDLSGVVTWTCQG